MANDPINELCQAFAQLSLLESPVATEAQAMNRNSLNYPAERTGSILASCGDRRKVVSTLLSLHASSGSNRSPHHRPTRSSRYNHLHNPLTGNRVGRERL
ncbi:hypothetical protein H633G_11437 [Metarhizium anisopliae BRIP 53284]|nr:hypothetical protein H633G_11437 [Metarhizium anisopliae BRIP 53284]